jgi:hypothetical protein
LRKEHEMKRTVLSLLALSWLLGSEFGYTVTNDYHPVATLTPAIPGGVLGDSFGHVIHADDDYLFVSAFAARPDPTKSTQGAVYVYRRTNGVWLNTQILTTGGRSDHFGAFAIRSLGQWLFIAGIGTPIGPFEPDELSDQDFTGSIRVYRRDPAGQYAFQQAIDRNTPGLERLSVVDPEVLSGRPPPTQLAEQGAAFGLSFDFSGHERLLVGAATQAYGDVPGNGLINAGAVYAFELRGGQWQLTQVILSPDGPRRNGTFGGVVTVDGDYALISESSIFTDIRLDQNTRVFLCHFEDGEWRFRQAVRGDQTDTLAMTRPTGQTVQLADNFGGSLALDGNWAVIGAPFEHLSTSTIRGAAYFYRVGGYNNVRMERQGKVVSDDPTALMTGVNVALRGRVALISDPARTGPAGAAQGAILRYGRQSSGWEREETLFDPAGQAGDLFGNGLELDDRVIFGGTGNSVASLYLRLFFSPPLLRFAPTAPNRVVIWER